MLVVIPELFVDTFYEIMDEAGWSQCLLAGGEKSTKDTEKELYKKDLITPEIRWEVWERDNFACRKCGNRRHLHIDHIHPESKSGKTELSNLQTLCRRCNIKKGNRI